MRNICKMIANPKIQTKDLRTHAPRGFQIFLFFGVAKAAAQFKLFGHVFVTAWDLIVRWFFSYNIFASRAWDWLGTPLSKETADL